MNETAINWTELTWNPMSGCTKISPECAHCYAYSLAEQRRGTNAFQNGFDLTIRPHKLAEPAKLKAPSLIFTNSMSDPGLDEVPDAYLADILDAMERSPQHRYQVLTKRPEELAAKLRRLGRRMPASVWMGVTIGVQRAAWRLDALRDIPGAVLRFVSAEPILEPLTLDLTGISWLITGGESGNHASQPKVLDRRFLVRRGDRAKGEPLWVPRPERMEWIRALRDQCDTSGVAHWFKQWGGPRPTSGGRMLDGRTHDGLPLHVPGAMPDGYEHASRSRQHEAPRVQLPLL